MDYLLYVLASAVALFGWRLVQREMEEWREMHPLLSDEAVAVLRPGDTCLLLLKLEGMTCDQQTCTLEAMKKVVDFARERGVEFIVIPDNLAKKGIVISRDGLPEQGDNAGNGGHDSGNGGGQAKGCNGHG